MQVTSKGQVTIPQAIRRKYRFDTNTQVEFLEENGRVYIQTSPKGERESRFAKFRGTSDTGLSTDQLLALTRTDPPETSTS